jgi:hypothetical protein
LILKLFVRFHISLKIGLSCLAIGFGIEPAYLWMNKGSGEVKGLA